MIRYIILLLTITISNSYALGFRFHFFNKMIATGGDISTNGSTKIHTFTTSGTITFSRSGYVSYIVVGGGGSGACCNGGGGGGAGRGGWGNTNGGAGGSGVVIISY